MKNKQSLSINKKSRIPIFKNLEEEARFWDTHSITDFEDEFEDVDLVIDLQRPKNETLILRLQKEIKGKLEYVAKRKGLSVSSLVRIWLMEKLQTSRI